MTRTARTGVLGLMLASAFYLPLVAQANADDAYRPYASNLVERLSVGVDELAQAVDDGDVGAAREAWIAARFGWERGETMLGEFFPGLDERIDLWPDAEQGFHAIEPVLFRDGELDRVEPMVESLQSAVDELESTFADTEITDQGLLNGTTGIVFEIGSEKAGGGESPFAGTSLTDMQNNMVGVEAAYALAFAPTVREKSPQLHRRILAQIVELTSALDVRELGQLDSTRVMRLSEQLAGSLQSAAKPLGLESPVIGG